MASPKMIEYYFEFELDGDIHVAKATGPAGKFEDPIAETHTQITGEEFTRRAVAAMHPGINVTVFRPLKHIDELAARSAELAMDPNHVPMTGIDLKEDAANRIRTAAIEEPQAVPAPVVLNSTGGAA